MAARRFHMQAAAGRGGRRGAGAWRLDIDTAYGEARAGLGFGKSGHNGPHTDGAPDLTSTATSAHLSKVSETSYDEKVADVDAKLASFLAEINSLPVESPSDAPADPDSTAVAPVEEATPADEEAAEPVSYYGAGGEGKSSILFVKSKEVLAPTLHVVAAGSESCVTEPAHDLINQPNSDEVEQEPTTVWQHCLDEGTQYYYFWNIETNEVTWEIPDDYSEYLLKKKLYDEWCSRSNTVHAPAAIQPLPPITSQQAAEPSIATDATVDSAVSSASGAHSQHASCVGPIPVSSGASNDKLIKHIPGLVTYAGSDSGSDGEDNDVDGNTRDANVNTEVQLVETTVHTMSPAVAVCASNTQLMDANMQSAAAESCAPACDAAVCTAVKSAAVTEPVEDAVDMVPAHAGTVLQQAACNIAAVVRGCALRPDGSSGSGWSRAAASELFAVEIAAETLPAVDVLKTPVQPLPLECGGETVVTFADAESSPVGRGGESAEPGAYSVTDQGALDLAQLSDPSHMRVEVSRVNEPPCSAGLGPACQSSTDTPQHALANSGVATFSDQPSRLHFKSYEDIENIAQPVGPDEPLVFRPVPLATVEGKDEQQRGKDGRSRRRRRKRSIADDRDSGLTNADSRSTKRSKRRRHRRRHRSESSASDSLAPTVVGAHVDRRQEKETAAAAAAADGAGSPRSGRQQHEDDLTDLSSTVLEKLAFFDVSCGDLSRLQLLLIQTKVRLDDWHSGGLDRGYLLDRLREADSVLHEYELHAVPPGWSCHWDSSQKRYFYLNEVTEEVQWEYPEDGLEEMMECAAAAMMQHGSSAARASAAPSNDIPAGSLSNTVRIASMEHRHGDQSNEDISRASKRMLVSKLARSSVASCSKDARTTSGTTFLPRDISDPDQLLQYAPPLLPAAQHSSMHWQGAEAGVGCSHGVVVTDADAEPPPPGTDTVGMLVPHQQGYHLAPSFSPPLPSDLLPPPPPPSPPPPPPPPLPADQPPPDTRATSLLPAGSAHNEMEDLGARSASGVPNEVLSGSRRGSSHDVLTMAAMDGKGVPTQTHDLSRSYDRDLESCYDDFMAEVGIVSMDSGIPSSNQSSSSKAVTPTSSDWDGSAGTRAAAATTDEGHDKAAVASAAQPTVIYGAPVSFYGTGSHSATGWTEAMAKDYRDLCGHSASMLATPCTAPLPGGSSETQHAVYSEKPDAGSALGSAVCLAGSTTNAAASSEKRKKDKEKSKKSSTKQQQLKKSNMPTLVQKWQQVQVEVAHEMQKEKRLLEKLRKEVL